MQKKLERMANLQSSLGVGSRNAADLHELAGLRLAAGDLNSAIDMYSRCLTFDCQNSAVYNNLGVVFIKAGRYAEAIDTLGQAIALQPGYVRALVNLGKAMREVGRLPEARAHLEEALVRQPGYVPALINLGEVLSAQGEIHAAHAALRGAVELAPRSVEAHMALGIVKLQSGESGAALESLRCAVRLGPDHADAHSTLAHALFSSGEWTESWPHFEHRLRRAAQRTPPRPPPRVERWNGRTKPQGELWVVGEQGLGDQLQFLRYAKLLLCEGFKCAFSCDPRLVKLAGMALPGIRVVPFDATDPEASTARWVPLMSLPHWHGTTPNSVPYAAGYLAADRLRLEPWRATLTALTGLKVAITWSGNVQMETGRHSGRSPNLAALEPLLRIPSVSFISLQKGPAEQQLDTVPFGGSILRLPNLDAGPDAFLDTAAVLQSVDLLITSDTAIAHLAGGLGIATWLCLMHEPDWRWMMHGTSTPWYDSLRLFRQPKPGDWASVFAQVAQALAHSNIGCGYQQDNGVRA
jgi:tetratricopeptide (TPR) repeat protein